jgi:hypothetical protein
VRIPRYQVCACHHWGWQHRGDMCVACDCVRFNRPRARPTVEHGVMTPVRGRKVAGTRYPLGED